MEFPGEQQGIGILHPVVRRLQPLQILAAVAGGLGRSLGPHPILDCDYLTGHRQTCQ